MDKKLKKVYKKVARVFNSEANKPKKGKLKDEIWGVIRYKGELYGVRVQKVS